MANQPKKYKKFVATAATATLVASAIVPVASASSFPDVPADNQFAEYIADVVELGLLKGYANGDFGIADTLTRGQVAIILGRLAEQAGFEAAADYETNPAFSDIANGSAELKKYASIVKEAGIFNGSNGKLNAASPISRQHMASVIVRSINEFTGVDLVEAWKADKFETSFKDLAANSTHSDNIVALEFAGIATSQANYNPNANINRGQFAKFLSIGVEVITDLQVELVAVKSVKSVDSTTLEVTLEEAQEELTADDFVVTVDGKDVTATTVTAVDKGAKYTIKHADLQGKKGTIEVNGVSVEFDYTALEVTSVSATNLKQVVVNFNTAVDKATASEKGNYTLTGANSPAVDSAVVSEDGRSVTLTLVDKFENQTEYKLSINNIKDGSKVFSAKDLTFKPLDNTVPTVSKVDALGNKTIRVQFSEPVKAAQTSQFLVDGKVVVGSIQTNANTVIIKLSSSLTDGEHTLTAEGTEDYNNFKTVKADTKFNVVEDKAAPTVTSVVSASFEKVVLKFSEPVEQVFASNIYWMQGGVKKQASSVKQLADDTFELTFAGDNKLVYTTDLFVTNVKDFSGNVIDKDTKVQVTPVIDQTRPEIISSTFVKDSNNKKIVIKFTKALDADTAKKAANYVIKDKDGKVQAISSTVDVSVEKEVTITLLGTLKDNSDYTLSVTGVSDNTTLKNVMLPYTTTLSVKDVTAPELLSVTRLNEKQLYVAFSEAMATSGDGSIVDTEKYTVTAPDGKKLTISSFNVTQDAKGVILNFNDTLPAAGESFTVKVQLVKDLAGNYLTGLTETESVENQNATTIESAKATAKDKVEVKFSNPIQSLVQGDFTVTGSEIAHSEISSDGKTVTFTLKKELAEDVKHENAAVNLTVKASPSTVDVLGKNITAETEVVVDKIKATVKEVVKVADKDNQIKITFNEAVTATDAKSDFVVVDNLNEDNKVAVSSVASVDGDTKSIILTLDKSLVSATVSVKDARFVKDGADNTIANIDATTVELASGTAFATAKTALTTSITTAQAAHNDATEGSAVGNSIVGSKATLNAAITAATAVKDNAASTLQQVTDAKTTLDAAVTAFNAAKVADITASLVAPALTMAGAPITNKASITGIALDVAAGETFNVTSATTANVTVDAATGLAITGVQVGTSVITVQVKNAAGNVIKTGTVTVTVAN